VFFRIPGGFGFLIDPATYPVCLSPLDEPIIDGPADLMEWLRSCEALSNMRYK